MTNTALRGKPDAGNPHVRFDEGEVASCTAEASLWRVHCRRQPEGRASVCAATPRRGSLLYKTKILKLLALSIVPALSQCALPRLTRAGVVRPAPPVRPSLVAASRLCRIARCRAWSSPVHNRLLASGSSLCGLRGKGRVAVDFQVTPIRLPRALPICLILRESCE